MTNNQQKQKTKQPKTKQTNKWYQRQQLDTCIVGNGRRSCGFGNFGTNRPKSMWNDYEREIERERERERERDWEWERERERESEREWERQRETERFSRWVIFKLRNSRWFIAFALTWIDVHALFDCSRTQIEIETTFKSFLFCSRTENIRS